MAGIGAISVPTAGAITEPARFPWRAGSAVISDQDFYGLHTYVPLPEGRGVLHSNGLGHMRHTMGESIYATGLPAPASAPTATPASPAEKASGAITTTGNFTSGDRFDLVSAGDQTNYSWPVVVVSAFSTSGDNLKYWQVLRESSASGTLDNIVGMVNGTSVNGVKFQRPTIDGDRQTADHPAEWSDWITATKTSSAIVTFTAIRYGQAGNTFELREVTDGGATWSVPGTTFSGGSGGTGVNPSAGVYFYRWALVRTVDGAMSGLSPAVEVDRDDPGNVTLASMTTPSQPRFSQADAKRWFRSAPDGREDKVWAGYDVVVSDTGDTDDLSDLSLFQNAPYEPDLYRYYEDGPIPKVRCLASYQSSFVGAGFYRAMDYSLGTVDVTNGSTTVTFNSPAQPSRLWEGRLFRVTTDASTKAAEYRLVYVNNGAGTTALLDRAYEGSTASGAGFTVVDDRDPCEIIWSVPGQWNNWPAEQAITGVRSRVGDGITALFSAFGVLVIFTRTGIWTLSGALTSPRINLEYEGVGCVGARAVCEAGGWLYFVSDDGVYRWGGRGVPERVSSGVGRDGKPWGIGATTDRINASRSNGCVAHYNEDERTAYFFVPLDGEETNRYALVLDLERKVWSLDDAPDVTYAETVFPPDGVRRMIVGTAAGDVLEYGIQTTDGCYGVEPVQTVGSATTSTIVLSGTPALTTSGDGLKGVQVLVVSSTGEVRHNIVAGNTSDTLTLGLTWTAPTAGDKVILGGIHLRLKTGKFHLDQPMVPKVLRWIEVATGVDSDGVYYVSAAGDQDDPSITSNTLDDGTTPVYGDLTRTDDGRSTGKETFNIEMMGNLLQVGLDCFEPGCDPSILGIRMVIGMRSPLHV